MAETVIELEERLKRELDDYNNMSEDEFRNLQDRKLRECLLHHFNNEFNDSYRKLLAENGIESEGDLPKSIDEIDRLPIVTRDFLEKANYVEKPAVDKSLVDRIVQTNGSTGVPFKMPHSYDVSRRTYGEIGARALIMNDVPLDTKQYFITHWIPDGEDNSSSHEYVIVYKELLGEDVVLDASSAHPIMQHYENLKRDEVEFSCSAPNFFLALLGFIKSQNLEPIEIKYIYSGGAAINDADKQIAKKGFSTENFMEIYISSEGYLMGVTLDEKHPYHIFSDEHLMEILDSEHKPVDVGESGNVVLTTFRNTTLPIIRYFHSDGATYDGKSDFIDKFLAISNVYRALEAQVGDGYITYNEIEREMPLFLKSNGIPVMAIQLAKQKHEDGLRDKPILRIETIIKDEDKIKRLGEEAFRKNFEMDYLLKSKEIAPLEVEIYSPGEMRKGKLKAPLFLDET